MRALLILICLLFPLASYGDDVSSGMPPDVSSSEAALTPAIVATPASIDPAVPIAPTEVSFRKTKASQDGKLTAGDVILVSVKPTAELGENALPSEIAAKIEQGPVEWGDGRVLWWTPFDTKTGTITIAMTTYKPGKLQIRPMLFIKDAKPVFRTELKEIEFSAVQGDKAKDEIYPPGSVGLPLWIWIILIILSLVVTFALIRWFSAWHNRHKTRVQELANAPKILTPLEEFEKVRRENDGKGLLDKGQNKSYYFALSDAAKRFLGKAYRFDAEERTTRELLVELERLGMAMELVDQWERLFDEMDITKFTDQVPESEVARSLGGRLSAVVSQSYSRSPVMAELLAQQAQALQQKARPVKGAVR